MHRVEASRPGEGMDLLDVLSGERVTVVSPSISGQASTGDVLVARVMHGPSASLWGPAAQFAMPAAGVLLDLVSRLHGPDVEGELRRQWPALMTFAVARPHLTTRAAWDLDESPPQPGW